MQELNDKPWYLQSLSKKPKGFVIQIDAPGIGLIPHVLNFQNKLFGVKEVKFSYISLVLTKLETTCLYNSCLTRLLGSYYSQTNA